MREISYQALVIPTKVGIQYFGLLRRFRPFGSQLLPRPVEIGNIFNMLQGYFRLFSDLIFQLNNPS